ncbi:TPA: hypothetical protein N0F65_012113 [Lagenidium giganteum]|uniref:Uncharacterized protein n=1 Tax=Lagenidium giganteum TaxID=4803 RepID=A0AAV2YUC1_9STRA|nr:TPA: hypothetical protein N0F65_012113 [Lagenidium giganteum]
MNVWANLALGAIVMLALFNSPANAEVPSLNQRRADIRSRILQARAAKMAAMEKKEYDFYHRDENKQR